MDTPAGRRRFPARTARRPGVRAEVRARGAGGTMTCVGHAGTDRTVRVRPGESATLRGLAR